MNPGRARPALLTIVLAVGLVGCAGTQQDVPRSALGGVPAAGAVPLPGSGPADAPAPDPSRTAAPSPGPARDPVPVEPGSAAPAPTAVGPEPASAGEAAGSGPAAAGASRAFSARVREIDDELAARMRTSWRPGCPVPLAGLRFVALPHWGTDGVVHEGELVVHADHAEALVSVFAELFAARFPIERMRLVDDYGGDDQASMRANNTSAFNCREVAGRPGVLSNHASGTAIDINPLVNPWVSGSRVDPPEGAPFADRSSLAPGGIAPGDVVTRAFARIGWGWGGDWPASKDWQHFSASGR